MTGDRVQTVGVDFDGVIHTYSDGWQDGSIYDEPVPGAFEALAQLQQDYAVFIHTSRDPKQVGIWLSERRIAACWTPAGAREHQFWNQRGTVLVTNRKLPAVAYIDDRAIRFRNWDQALADLAEPDRLSLKVATVSVKMADIEPVKSFITDVARVAVLDTMTADEIRTALETALRDLGVTR